MPTTKYEGKGSFSPTSEAECRQTESSEENLVIESSLKKTDHVTLVTCSYVVKSSHAVVVTLDQKKKEKRTLTKAMWL